MQSLHCNSAMALPRVLLATFVAVLLTHSHTAAAAEATLMLLRDAVNEGAVCLDGSPPGYYFRPGSGSGAKSWIVHMEGGGVCSTEEECVQRSKTSLGSSKNWPPTATFDGFLSDSNLTNPDFYNWSVAFLMYCDGASFGGYVDNPVNVNGTTLHFRGFPVLQANIKSLLSRGMSDAERVILTGCSAGGIGTYIHADFVKTMLPESVTYHAMADAGYFIDALNIHGEDVIRELVVRTSLLHNSTRGANQKCVAAHQDEIWMCGFAQYIYPFITTPIFMLNSAWDTWQLKNILQLDCYPWECPPDRKKAFDNYGQEFLKAAAPVIDSQTSGVFVDSCLEHCQSLSAKSWSQIKVGGKTARETFSSWYFKNGGDIKEVDCAYPCNPTC